MEREFDMSHVLYTVDSRETLFDGKCDIEDMRKEPDCWYEGVDRERIGGFTRGSHVCDLYRYTDTAFGDFTAYEEEGNLWIPENFSDYTIFTHAELMLAIDEGATFWQDWETDDPEARLLYKIFQNY